HHAEGSSDEHAHGHDDHDHGPHVWLSIAWLKAEAERLAGLFGELSPRHADEFRAAAERTIRELDELDAELRSKLAPLRGERFFVYHPAYGAFAEEFGLIETAVEQGGKPPDDRTLSRLQEQAAEATLKVLIVQPQITSPAVEAVARSADLKTATCDPLAEDVPSTLRALAETLVEAYEASHGG
ncbi:MAG: ABC transporter substrate-binding protein, partial [Planctomycetota bacterium]